MRRLEIVLLETGVGGNLGSICRALKTLGFPPPLLINPKNGILSSPEARRLAHGAREYLDHAGSLESVDELFRSFDFVIGTTDAHRRTVGERVEPGRLPALLESKGGSVGRAALLFGSEARGLSSEILSRCDLVSTLPLATSHPSLNLAQAVLIYAYELSPLRGGTGAAESLLAGHSPPAEAVRKPGHPPATAGHRALRRRLEERLAAAQANSALIGRVAERVALLCEGDVALAHSVLTAVERGAALLREQDTSD
ncbi:MAG: TrmH family RNA methyltransferase [Spirochaetaceae bacterium]